jgi:hypothetical protein
LAADPNHVEFWRMDLGVNDQDYTQRFEYWPDSTLKRKQLADGSWTGSYIYDLAGRLYSIANANAPSATEPAKYLASNRLVLRVGSGVTRADLLGQRARRPRWRRSSPWTNIHEVPNVGGRSVSREVSAALTSSVNIVEKADALLRTNISRGIIPEGRCSPEQCSLCGARPPRDFCECL